MPVWQQDCGIKELAVPNRVLCAIENIVRLLHGYAARNAALHRFRLDIRMYMYVTLMNELVE